MKFDYFWKLSNASQNIVFCSEDIKPNATELNKEINKQNVSNQLPQTASSKDNIQSDSPHNKGCMSIINYF